MHTKAHTHAHTHTHTSVWQEMVCEEAANHPDAQCLTALHADETGSFMFTGACVESPHNLTRLFCLRTFRVSAFEFPVHHTQTRPRRRTAQSRNREPKSTSEARRACSLEAGSERGLA